MQGPQPEAGAKIAGIREEVRRIAQRDDRRSAAGCGVFMLMLAGSLVAMSLWAPVGLFALFPALFATLGLLAVSRITSARRIASRLRHRVSIRSYCWFRRKVPLATGERPCMQRRREIRRCGRRG